MNSILPHLDGIFVFGFISLCLAAVSLLNSYAHNKGLKGPMMLATVGCSAMALAMTAKPDGYDLAEAPKMVINLLSGFIG